MSMLRTFAKRFMYLMKSGAALDRLIKAEEYKAADEYRKDNMYRLALCRKHRQEANHSEYSEHHCCYCQAQKHIKEQSNDITYLSNQLRDHDYGAPTKRPVGP